jgi:hypothetical protein
LGSLLAIEEAFAEERRKLPRAAANGSTALRDRYMLSPEVTYLNHGSIGTIPRAVHEARAAYLEICETNPWLYMWSGAWEDLALGDAIDFHEALGRKWKEERCAALWERLRLMADESDRVAWRSPRSWPASASLFALEIRGTDSQDVFDFIHREHGFVFRPFNTQGLNTVRIWPNVYNNVYNTEEEVARYFEHAGSVNGGR